MNTGPSAVIELADAAFGYGERPVVSDVTLSIAPGEVVAVLGPNGSGKSTLVKGILGLADQFAGQVRLFGVPRAEFREHPRLGYVPQRHTLSGTVRATVTEVVATGRLSRQRWFGRFSGTDATHVDPAPSCRRRSAACRGRPRARRHAVGRRRAAAAGAHRAGPGR